MADFVISPLVDHLVSHALEKIEEEVKLVKNVKQDVENLKSRLVSIQALLEDAERKQIDSKIIKLWLSKLEDTSFRVDNVLDGWNSDILKAQIEKEQGEVDESVADPNKKVCLPVLSSCFRFKPVLKQVLDHREIAKKVQDLNKDLDAILEETSRLGIVAAAVEQSQQQKASLSLLKPKSTTSLVDEKEIHGRDEVKETLVGKLLCESSHGKNVELILIVGTGGLGKTTLAQLAYNDERIKKSFHKRIWVCVSEPFEEFRIAKEIFKGLGGDTQNAATLGDLLEPVRDMVKEQKFLLVLDDVWTKKYEDWRRLEYALRDGGAGSRILVTTRNQEVAIMMKARTRMITLELLSDECCWSIIKQLAVEGTERDQAKVAELEKIGQEIARKCKGLPLIATTLGSLLCFKETKYEWEGILDNKLWQSQEDFAPFLLSYYDLSLSERRCLSYCSIFPKDHEIKRDQLIGMWMSQGYFSSGREGKEHFKSLCMRSLFQDIQKDSLGAVYCKMHDIVHDFVQYLTKGKFYVIKVDDMEGKMEENVRHLTTHFSNLSVLKFNGKNRENMRSLIFTTGGSNLDEFSFLDLPRLRTLGLCHLRFEELPESITGMRHLRYLDLSDNWVLRELPESLCDLCNLQTLNLDMCFALERLPKGIGKLVNLRNLYIQYCKLEGLPKGIRKLRSLEKLDMFVIPSKEKREEYFDVGDFNELKCLQYQEFLEIRQAGNLENMDEAKKINLENMEDLVFLRLAFGNDNSDPQHQITILEALKPHPYLETLTIRGYKGHPTCSPKWLSSLAHLKRLYLFECVYCERLSPLGKLLPSLESLGLCYVHLKKLPQNITGMRHLRYLDLSWNGSLKELPESLCDLCNLQTLKLDRCFSLGRLPKGIGKLVNLRNLYIERCSLEGLPKGIRKLRSLEKLDLFVIPSKEKREEYFDAGDFNELKCLQYQGFLIIRRAGNLENTDEAKKINLESMEDLVHLVLWFGNDNSDPQHQITILEALKPHPYLETLTILDYKGHPTCSPKWLTSLAHLKRLTLEGCVNCEILPPLGKLLPSLESLAIREWKSVKKVGHELLGIEEGKRKDPSQSSFVSFPKLERLCFFKMDEWKEWEGSIPEDENLQVMPSLCSLELHRCHKLEGLPDFLRMIRLPTLSIWGCKILKQGCQKGTGKEWLKISHIPNIEIDFKYVQRDGIWVQKDDVTSEDDIE